MSECAREPAGAVHQIGDRCAVGRAGRNPGAVTRAQVERSRDGGGGEESSFCVPCVPRNKEKLEPCRRREAGREGGGGEGLGRRARSARTPCIIKLSSGRGGAPPRPPKPSTPPRNMTWSYCRLPALMIEELQYMDHGRIDR